MEGKCHCGKPLHYTDPVVERMITALVEQLGEYAAGRNPKGYTEADVPRLIKEVRAEKPRRRKVRSNG